MSAQGQAERLAKAIKLHQDGALAKADKIYLRILKSQPDHLEALHYRGVVKTQQGHHVLAEDLLIRACKLSGSDPMVRFHLAELYAATDRHTLALEHYQAAAAAEPGNADILYMYGNSLFELQQFNEAIIAYEAALKLQPTDTECQLNLANTYEAVGKFDLAIELLEPLTATSNSVLLDLQLALLLANTQKLQQAEVVVCAISQIRESDISIAVSNCKPLFKQQCRSAVMHLLSLLQPHYKTLTSAQYDIIVGILNDLGQYSEVKKLLALQSNRYAWSYFQEGLYAQACGEFSQAIGCHQKALTLDDTLGAAAYSLASIGGNKIESDQCMQWQAKSQDATIDGNSRAQYAFAVARVQDQQKNYDIAFEYYALGNRLMAEPMPFKLDEWDQNIESIISTFDKSYFDSISSKQSDDGDHLVFIVGMPRSGSTMLEQILVGRGGMAGLGEHFALTRMVTDIPELTGFKTPPPECVNDLTEAVIEALRAFYLKSLPAADAGKSVVYVDKMLGNFNRLGVLARVFPGAKILHACRDPMATGVSCYTNVFANGLRFTYDLYNMGRAYRSYERLMSHWHAVLPLKILNVHYEQLVVNPEIVIDEISDFLGLPMNNEGRELLHKQSDNTINTASFWQARQPISTASVESWRRFDGHLDPLRKGLSES